jgi:hypothetical protein
MEDATWRPGMVDIEDSTTAAMRTLAMTGSPA